MRTLTRPKTYRPPRGGEPSRLREDGHWSMDGLVGYWRMDAMTGGIVRDLSPYGNHGTMTNMDPATDWVAGERGGALDFDGSNEYVALQHHAMDALTILVRVYPRTVSSWDAILSRSNWDHYWTAWMNNGNLVTSLGGHKYSTLTMTAGTWHTAAWIIPANGSLRWWLDGTSDTGVNVTAADSQSYPIYIGKATGYYVDGLIEYVLLYERELSATEIAALYADPDLPMWRPRRGISLAALDVPVGGLPLLGRTLGRTGPSLSGVN